MNWHWWLRMSRLARNPMSAGQFKLLLVVILLCLAVAAVQKLGYWPDWLTAPIGRRHPKV